MAHPESFLIYNDQVCFASSKLLTAQNTAFRFGDGLFETMRMVQDGTVPFLDDHVARLKKGMQVLQMGWPKRFSKNFFRAKIKKLRTKNRVNRGARVRLTVLRDSQGVFPPKTEISYILEVEPAEKEYFTLNTSGWTLGCYKGQLKPVSSLSNYKTNNYLCSVLGKLHAQKEGFDDCCLFNTDQEVIETTTANIFVVNNDILSTPPVRSGCVDGVMRKQMFRWFDINEQTLSENDLLQADEIFLTNAFTGIRWIKKFKGKNYTTQWGNKVMETLKKELRLA